MEAEIIDSDTACSSAPIDYDKARHLLTIADAVELFVQLGTPRSKRSVQRFCEQGHLDCVRIKGPRSQAQTISRRSVSLAESGIPAGARDLGHRVFRQSQR